jgi:hypothetical protein
VGWRDRAIGIALGVVAGVGIVVAFVFLLSDQTVDAPSLSGVSTTNTSGSKARGPHRPAGPPSPATVRVIGGAPPPSGPAELHYRRGAKVRLRVISDSTLALTLTGYDLSTMVPAGEPTMIELRASRSGTFGLIVAESHIDVARITVGGPSP